MFKAFQNLVSGNNDGDKSQTTPPQPTRGGGFGGLQIIDPSATIKANSMDIFSRNALEFIGSGANSFDSQYDERMLLNAYMSSVYVYAGLRRVANLISRVKIVAEHKRGDNWVRLPETHRLNIMFDANASKVLPLMWLNQAIYGSTLVYKTKTRRAILEERSGRPIYDFKDGAVAGLHVLDNPLWDLDEGTAHGEIKGVFVNQYDTGDAILGDRSYLDRREFIYATEWNPENRNRGKSRVAVCIHEAVANAAIAQWMSEYFTRGAMPFIMVSLAEDDPAMMTDADLRKYKRQFEEYWQGIKSSLRSVFFDRRVQVDQVGINAGDVGAPDLNETALEGISATIGLDRELIVTPTGGSQERHALLIKRAWEDTVKPLALHYLDSFKSDLGLPEDIRLTLDLSGISELEAERDEKSGTEISIYEAGIQSWNEARTRLMMPPVPEFDNLYNFNDRPVTRDAFMKASQVPTDTLQEYAYSLWDNNLAKRSEVLMMLGRTLPEGDLDGYKYQIEEHTSLVGDWWSEDLLTRKQVLTMLGLPLPDREEWDDGYRSELERGADYGDWITGLWSDNLLTRSQTIQMLDIGLTLPEGSPDGYADEIGDRKSNVMDMWGDNLLTRSQALDALGIKKPRPDIVDGYTDEVQAKIERLIEAEDLQRERILDLWGDNLLTRGVAMDALGIPKPDDMIDGFSNEVEGLTDIRIEKDGKELETAVDLWGENLMTKKQVLEKLGISIPNDLIDGYQQEVDIIAEALAEQEASELTAPEEDATGGFGRTLNRIRRDRNNPSGGSGITYADYKNPPKPKVEPISSDDIDATIADTIVEEPEIDGLKDAIMEAEDDWYETDHDEWLSPAYIGDDMDYIPTHLLPEAEGDWITDDIYDVYEPYIDDSELEIYGLREPEGAVASEKGMLKNESHSYLDDELEDIDMIVHYAQQEIGDYLATTAEIMVGVDVANNSDDNQALYISLDLSNNQLITDVQSRYKELVEIYHGDSSEFEWQSPDTFHVTLVYVPDIDDDKMNRVRSILPLALSHNIIKVVGLSTFDNEDATVIKLDVELNDYLSQLQSKLVMAFNAYGITISEHSRIGSYNPHITLAYAPPNIKVAPIDFDFSVSPNTILIGRDNYNYVNEISFKDIFGTDEHSEPDGTDKGYLSDSEIETNKEQLDYYIKSAQLRKKDLAYQSDIDDEFRAWERATLKRGIGKGLKFETVHIPSHIEASVKSELSSIDGHDTQAIKSIFKKYRE